MPTNKAAINEKLLVDYDEPGRTLGVFGWLRVDEGRQAVITVDGRYQETVGPGRLFLGRYGPISKIKVYLVDVRDRQMTVEVTDELHITRPALLRLQRLSVVVSYRVADARIVALQVEQPLATLWDYVLEAMRSAVAQLTYEDFLVGGSAGQLMMDHLRTRNLEQYLSIQVIMVQVGQIEGHERVNSLNENTWARPAEQDLELAVGGRQRDFDRGQALQDAINDGDMAKVATLTPALVAQRYPQMYEAIYGNRAMSDMALTNALVELAKAGAIDPTPLLTGRIGPAARQPGAENTGGWGPSLTGGQSLLASPVITAGPGARRGGGPTGPGGPLGGGTGGGGEGWPAGISRADRMEEEAGRIATLTGSDPRVSHEEDASVFFVPLQDGDGRTLEIFITCQPTYPASRPEVLVVVDGQETPHNGPSLSRWTAQRSLADVVEEIRNFY